MGPPALQDISLDKLEKSLSDLESKFSEKIRLRQVSYDRASNEMLGFPNGSTDFTVFMPSKDLTIRNRVGPFPTDSQQAFMDVVSLGLERTDTKIILIDIASLGVDGIYLNREDDKSVIMNLAKALEKLGETNPKRPVVIRMLLGGSDMGKTWKDLKGPYESFFWSGEEGNKRRRIKHPNATLYVGHYCPDFAPSKDDKDITNIKASLHKLVKESLDLIGISQISSILGSLGSFTPAKMKEQIDGLVNLINVDKIVDDVVVNHPVPTITWNHGKILAVNGTTLMTGGINYTSVYGDNQNHDICDHSVKIKGDAAISAHRFLDYFWKYLADKSPTDRQSVWRHASLSNDNIVWEEGGPIPDSQDYFQRIVSEKKLETLTTSKLGDWWGDMAPIRYPVQLFDGLRDIILNLAWQWLLANLPAQFLLQYTFMKLAIGLSDDALSTDKFHSFKDVGINPTAWASRYARAQAISYANHSIVLCQPMIADWLQNGTKHWDSSTPEKELPAWGKFVVATNKRLGLPEGKAWNGVIWPFELLMALARALGNMSRSKTPNPRPGKKEFQKDSKGIYIVLTTNKEGGSEPEWEDRTSIKELMERLTIIINNLPTEHGGIPSKDIPNVLKTMIHFKRTGTDKDVKGADLYSHSKLVCVDRKVMYVGSDNAYPSYNEEHGVWIDDQKTIDTWLDGFFTGYWNKLQDPFDV